MERVGFVTCVRLGLSCIEAIYEVDGELQLAVTLRDDLARQKSGRIFLDDFCSRRRVPLCKIRNLNDPDAVSAIRGADLDWLFVIGWSQIAGSDVLRATRRGVLGMHPTLLPIGRGRAPIPWAILYRLPETGVTLFQLDAGVDTGPIIAQYTVPVEPRETATSLYAKIDHAHAALLREHWHPLMRGELSPQPQQEERATTWSGRRPEDGRLTSEMNALEADCLIRAVTHPYPGAFIDTPEGRLRIWSSGAPMEDLGGLNPESNVLRLQFRDGWLDATIWVEE